MGLRLTLKVPSYILSKALKPVMPLIVALVMSAVSPVGSLTV